MTASLKTNSWKNGAYLELLSLPFSWQKWVALAASYGTPFIIVAGTTLGMLIADVPAVWIGDKLSEKIPVKWVRLISAVLFVIIGIFVALDFTPKIS